MKVLHPFITVTIFEVLKLLGFSVLLLSIWLYCKIVLQRTCILEFDGASKGNPGQAGAGAVLRTDDGNLVNLYDTWLVFCYFLSYDILNSSTYF